jgi:hypothetical protein
MSEITSMVWPEIDNLELTAHWIDKSNPMRFAVQRVHKGIRRGYWEFEYAGKMGWGCVRAGACYLREPSRFSQSRLREVDDYRIPNDVQLKAKEFLTSELTLIAKRKR